MRLIAIALLSALSLLAQAPQNIPTTPNPNAPPEKSKTVTVTRDLTKAQIDVMQKAELGKQLVDERSNSEKQPFQDMENEIVKDVCAAMGVPEADVKAGKCRFSIPPANCLKDCKGFASWEKPEAKPEAKK